MSSTTQDPTKYYRTGVAIPLHRKQIFDERLQKLGLRTIGDLATAFILAEGVVEALVPVFEKYRQTETYLQNVRGSKTDTLNELRKLSGTELARLLELAKQSEVI